MAKMTHSLWRGVEFFGIDERWGDPFQMETGIIYELEALRQYVDRPINVHCGYEQRATGGFHGYGMAVDFDIEGMHVVDQYLAASRFDGFNGLGLYPNWNKPGLHGDCRSKPQRFFADARWISPSQGVYLPLDKESLRRYCR